MLNYFSFFPRTKFDLDFCLFILFFFKWILKNFLFRKTSFFSEFSCFSSHSWKQFIPKGDKLQKYYWISIGFPGVFRVFILIDAFLIFVFFFSEEKSKKIFKKIKTLFRQRLLGRRLTSSNPSGRHCKISVNLIGSPWKIQLVSDSE